MPHPSYQGDPAPHNIHDDRNIAQLFCPVIAYHKQSELKCQSLCRGLPKLYRDHKKILRPSGFFAGPRMDFFAVQAAVSASAVWVTACTMLPSTA